MREYELMLILALNSGDKDRSKVLTGIEEIINRGGGKIIKKDEWGEQELAYPIKKKERGFIIFYHLNLPTNLPSKLTSKVHLMEEILRIMVLKKEGSNSK